MKPILFNQNETRFTDNGRGRLVDCISCVVTEERNGIFECEFQYPVTGRMFSEIKEGRIIGIIHDDSKDIQPFDIYAHSTPLNGIVTFYAHHISYRLGNVILKPMTASSCVEAFTNFPNKTYNPCPFSFWTDKAVAANWENDIPSPIKAILGGSEGSILDIYGKGEYEWDKWTVKLHTNRGHDNGVSIRYGVNLTDLLHDYDISGSYNAVVPYWKSKEEGTLVTLSDGYIAVDEYLQPWTTHTGAIMEDGKGNVIYFKTKAASIAPIPMDLSDAFENQPTEAQLQAEAVRRLQNSEAWLPSENITVQFVNLADTEEYKNISALQRVRLCDKVSVYCGPLGVSAIKMQVIKVVYDVLAERYDEIELGKPKTRFADTLNASMKSYVEEKTAEMVTSSMMQEAIDNATDHITGAQDSHVTFVYDANGGLQEILIMDTDSVTTATKVWRWNSGGLGYSSNGYAGPYSLAMTQDGAIVADMITTGVLSANLIKAGILSDGAGKNFWNLLTGEFSLSGGAAFGNSTVSAVINAMNSAISDVDVEYAQNQSTTTAPTSRWSTTAPTWRDGYYIWQRTKTTAASGVSYSRPTCISGRDGATGPQGQTGATGIGVSAIVEQYYLSTSSTSQTGGSWSTSQPAWTSGKYIWTRSMVTWTDNTTTYTTPVLAQAINGANSTANAASNAVTALDNSLDQEEVFNRLTNNGQTQGIYLKNGKLYINATYIDTGTLTADLITAGTMSAERIFGGTLTIGGANNANGVLTVKDASGNNIGTWNKDGISINAGEINCKLTGSRGNDDSIIINELAGSSAWMAFQTIVTPASNIPRYVRIDSDDGVFSVQDGTDSNDYAAVTYLTGRYLKLANRYGYDVTHNLDNYIEVQDLYQDRWTEKPRRSRIRPYSIEVSRNYYDPYGTGETTKQIFFVDEAGMVVSGTKSRSVATDQYSDRLLYCYETPTPMFGDIGDGVISDDGFCYVTLDAVFAQTVTTEQYQVFLQKYGPGDCWVRERKGAYFIVEGTPGLSFGWEVKAKQRDYDQKRLERNDKPFTVPEPTYGANAADYLTELQKGRISA